MSVAKTKCKRCGLQCRVSRAQLTGGFCKGCDEDDQPRQGGHKSARTVITPSDIGEGLGLGLRLILGLFFGSLAGGLGYALGAGFMPLTGYALAIPLAGTGFVYGCFCVEINAILRTALPFLVE